MDLSSAGSRDQSSSPISKKKILELAFYFYFLCKRKEITLEISSSLNLHMNWINAGRSERNPSSDLGIDRKWREWHTESVERRGFLERKRAPKKWGLLLWTSIEGKGETERERTQTGDREKVGNSFIGSFKERKVHTPFRANSFKTGPINDGRWVAWEYKMVLLWKRIKIGEEIVN